MLVEFDIRQQDQTGNATGKLVKNKTKLENDKSHL